MQDCHRAPIAGRVVVEAIQLKRYLTNNRLAVRDAFDNPLEVRPSQFGGFWKNNDCFPGASDMFDRVEAGRNSANNVRCLRRSIPYCAVQSCPVPYQG